MRYIAHRGLFQGPDLDLENNPSQILLAISEGYDVEVDVWNDDGEWWLGHDAPKYKIPVEFLNNRSMWIHCKNIHALQRLSKMRLRSDFFWHQEDDFTLTAKGFIWTYPGKPLTDHSIMVMPEWAGIDFKHVTDLRCAGVCSDFIADIREDYAQRPPSE